MFPFIALAAAPVALLCGYDVVTERLVSKYERSLDRDPATGIIKGAEPLDLGPPDASGAVLFVHGILGTGNNFNRLPRMLADRGWRVRVMLLPGHGTSPRDMIDVTAEDLIRAVTVEYKALRARHDTVVLVGHSMGGTLCSLVAAEQKTDRLVLAAPYFGVSHKWYYLLKPEQWTDVAGPFVDWVYKGDAFVMVNRKEAKDSIMSYHWAPTAALRTLVRLGERANAPDVLGRILCPALLIHSPGDEAASYEAAVKAFEALGSADKRIVRLETSNHHVFWDYEHERVETEIVRFVGEM